MDKNKWQIVVKSNGRGIMMSYVYKNIDAYLKKDHEAAFKNPSDAAAYLKGQKDKEENKDG